MCSFAATTARRKSGPERLASGARSRTGRSSGRRIARTRTSRASAPFEPVEGAFGLGRRRLALDLVGDEQQTLLGVVEGDDLVEAPEDRHRQPPRIRRTRRDPLDQPHQVEAEGADEAAGERHRQLGCRVALDQRAQRRERRAGEVAAAAVALDLEAVGIEAVDLARRGAEEAEARHLLAAGDALEEKAHRRERLQALIDRERRHRLRQQLAQMGRDSLHVLRFPVGRGPVGSLCSGGTVVTSSFSFQ